MRWFKKIYKLLYSYLNYKWLAFTGKQPKVRWLTWEVTDACNSRCLLCNIWKTKACPDLLSLEEIKKAFSDPLLSELELILLTGGEPVLRKDLIDIILFIHQKVPKAKFSLSTNAIMPERVLEVVETALQNNVHINVGLSIDGIGEHHDRIRGVAGNFAKADQLVNQLLELRKKYKCDFEICAGLTLHPQTINYVNEVHQYTKNKGIGFLAQLYDEAPYYHNVGQSAAGENLDIDSQRMMQVIKGLPPSYHNEILLKIIKNKIIKFDCFTMRSFFILRANGNVMPCLRLCDYKIGNVKQQLPSEIWAGKTAAEARKMVKECQGCANTWATDWSMRCNIFPFVGILRKDLLKKIFK